MRTTGDIIKKYILNRNINITELSEILEVSQPYISSVITDKKPPSKNILEKFYNYFEILEKDKREIDDYEKFRRLPLEFQEKIISLETEVFKLNNKPDIYVQENTSIFLIKESLLPEIDKLSSKQKRALYMFLKTINEEKK